ncbi:TonB-dependent receptor [Rhizorhabdus wittichii]|uniref:TonB-dependent receptor n=1 Tax=Rhizorhabdus wittichii TaxID=160791 RepID=A0A975HCF4_9SPHN|nr:TonB-dependent receptor [Rhizorhabdus wittichii]QTH20202.1 TonB-dependent receptor [Rhizorhabdus wittichii]
MKTASCWITFSLAHDARDIRPMQYSKYGRVLTFAFYRIILCCGENKFAEKLAMPREFGGMRQIRNRLKTTVVTVFLCTVAMPATAQIAATPANGYDDDAGFGSDIVVTARKREETLQTVGVSVTAISGKQLEEFNITSFEDYATAVPGLSTNFLGPVNSLGVRPVGLRGVQTVNGTQASGQNTVGFYINNTPIPISNPRLVDIERIEVLRGPQGTLYGSSSLAGTIKIITKAPDTARFEGRGMASISSTRYSSDANYEAEGSVNIPISATLAVRASGYYERTAGYIDWTPVTATGVIAGAVQKDVNKGRAYGGRIDALWKMTPDLSLRAAYSYNRREADASERYTVDQRKYSALLPVIQPGSDKGKLAEAEIAWSPEKVDVASTVAYYRANSFQITDSSNNARLVRLGNATTPLSISVPNTGSQREFTTETRAVSKWDGPLDLVTGIFYTDRREVTTSNITVPGAVTVGGQPVTNGLIVSNYSARYRKEFALFGEAGLKLWDIGRATAGLRYFDFKYRTFDDFRGSPLFVRNGAFVTRGKARQDGFVPRFGMEVEPAKNRLIYATVAKGFRMGGANFPLPSLDSATGACDASLRSFFGQAALPSSYKSDSLWSYELGAKGTFLNGGLKVNAAGFHIDWKNTQVAVQVSGTGCSFGGLSTNVGSVRSRGFELEMTANPSPHLSFTIAASRIDSKVAEDLIFPNATVFIARKGDKVPDIPNWTVALFGQYRAPISDKVHVFVRGDTRLEGERFAAFAPGNPSRPLKPSFVTTNFRVGADIGNIQLSLYIENAFDEDPRLLGLPAPAGQTIGTRFFDQTIRPRTIGTQLNFKF